MIAIAIACEPKLLIADEATTALDVTIQAQILALLDQLRRDFGMALMVISHDLGVVSAICDSVQVMYAGVIVERGPVRRLLEEAEHPYTQGLLRLVPRLTRCSSRLRPIPGHPPQFPPSRRFRSCRGASTRPNAQETPSVDRRTAPVIESVRLTDDTIEPKQSPLSRMIVIAIRFPRVTPRPPRSIARILRIENSRCAIHDRVDTHTGG